MGVRSCLGVDNPGTGGFSSAKQAAGTFPLSTLFSRRKHPFGRVGFRHSSRATVTITAGLTRFSSLPLSFCILGAFQHRGVNECREHHETGYTAVAGVR